MTAGSSSSSTPTAVVVDRRGQGVLRSGHEEGVLAGATLFPVGEHIAQRESTAVPVALSR